MKKYLSLLLLAITLVSTEKTAAQSAQVATLTHNNEVRMFTSSSALNDAHAAATDGDIITLSPGTFSGITVTKHITIRGAGMFPEDNGTIITGDLIIKPTTIDDSQVIALEGLDIPGNLCPYTFNKTSVSKCYIGYYNNYYSKTKTKFINSFIMGWYTCGSGDDIVCINSCVIGPRTSSKGTYVFENCYITYASSLLDFYNSTIKNSIINIPRASNSFSSSNLLVNNYIITAKGVLSQCTSVNNKSFSSLPEGFWKDSSRYVLSDKYASECLGSDGTQVGIYGGMLPFDPTPSNPQISKFNVASKTSADGKLSVEIEVKSAQ